MNVNTAARCISPVVTGSGAEDIGISHEMRARVMEHRAMSAEQAARKRRTDRDKLIALAIAMLESHTGDCSMDASSYMLGMCGIFAPADTTDATYARELLADIRRELSPLATTIGHMSVVLR
jgi:hypothetical protein